MFASICYTVLLTAFVWSIGECDSLDDVEHIIIFMQENRAFDHYYGTMKGVRGFNDRAAPLIPTGRSPFYQPINVSNSSAYMLPYPLFFNVSAATCMQAPTMAYECDINMWNNGRMDGWNTARSAGYGMSYFTRSDLPFYYALSDNFLVGDQYFQSTFTQTNPNRLHLFSGSNGLSAGSIHNILDDSEPKFAMRWTTFAETLEDAGVSWKVYQESNNFDDNGFAWFDQFKRSKAGSSLYDKGMARQDDLVQAFYDDMSNGTLPQVSWIIAPSYLSEHATNHPQDGEDLSARLLAALFDHPDVYAKSIFILNYDEGGQFYDHHWVPTAPMNDNDGQSTVTVEGERTKFKHFNVPSGNPIGPGFRVPLFIISPWTRAEGGIVYSQVSDHTSTIQLMEKRFNVTCENISPWRRAVMSDLLYAFDFNAPNYSIPILPDTSNNVNQSHTQCATLPKPTVPTQQFMPSQEYGTKISRHLPYEFEVNEVVSDKDKVLKIEMKNVGAATVVFHIFDYLNLQDAPSKYTIQPGYTLWHKYSIDNVMYNISLHGPNGYVRGFASQNMTNSQTASIQMNEYPTSSEVAFNISVKDAVQSVKVVVVDMAYGKGQSVLEVGNANGMMLDQRFSVKQSGNWYDWRVQERDENTGVIVHEVRFMGRVETGKDTITDPAMAQPIKDLETESHPSVQSYWDRFVENTMKYRAQHETYPFCKPLHKMYGEIKDMCWEEKN